MNNEKDKNLNALEPQEETAAPQQQEEAREETAAPQQEATEEKATKKQDSGKKKSGKKLSFKKYLQSPRFKHGSMATVMTAGVVVIAVLVNMLVGILADRFPSMNWDMTKSNSNSLSDKALEIVDGVTQPTEISLILTESEAKSNQYYSQVATLAEKMAERNGNITVQYIDADANPGFIAPYTEDGLAAGGVLVKTEKRSRVVTQGELFPSQIDYSTYQTIRYNDVDAALANAVSAVNVAEMPVVAFDTGHNEGMDTTYLQSFLKSSNFDTVTFNLLTDEIPEEAQVIVPDYQLSLAIGKEGQNARLAARLTGYKIDIKSETQARELGMYYQLANDCQEEYDGEYSGEEYQEDNWYEGQENGEDSYQEDEYEEGYDEDGSEEERE